MIIATISAQSWSLTGNAISSTNFLGSTNNQSLVFKANNTFAGKIDVTYSNTFFGLQSGGTIGASSVQNTAIGNSSFYSNTSGYENVSVGYLSMYSNTSGYQNVAIGYVALQSNTNATGNTAIGSQSLYYNTASYNTGVGLQASYHNTTGLGNNAFGAGALWANTTGTSNNAIGWNSLRANTIGNYNTATGVQALSSNTTGSYSTAVGYQALFNFNGGGDVAIGYQALYSNLNQFGNTAVGMSSLYSNIASQNTALGDATMYFNTTGEFNTAVGYSAGGSTTGSGNTGIGKNSLGQNLTGNDNSAIGFGSGPGTGFNNLSNTTALGYLTYTTASNQVRVGNSSVTSIGGYANWTNISDGRVKKNIKNDVPGLAFINKLQPITYNLDLESADNIMQLSPQKEIKTGKIIPLTQEEIIAKTEKEKIVYTGFIAQDVEKAAKSLNYNFSGVDSAKSDKDLYGLRYADFVVPLVKAVQELSAQNDSLRNINNQLQSQLAELSKRVDTIESLQNKDNTNTSNTMRNSGLKSITLNETGRLDQNLPNPFNANTTIHYYIPENANNAKIIVTDISGNILKDITVNNKGTGQIVINAGTLSSGNYTYSLIIDNMKIQSKQMILIK